MHAGRVTLAEVRDGPLSVDEVVAAVSDRAAGAVVTFTGVVRDHDGLTEDGRPRSIERLDYSAHPSADAVLNDVLAEVAARDGVLRVAATHRTGTLDIGDLAVVAAVAAAHRGPAFEGCRILIDRLKERVPIWKHQLLVDGGEEWVGAP